jgi:hypothetical protein
MGLAVPTTLAYYNEVIEQNNLIVLGQNSFADIIIQMVPPLLAKQTNFE